MVPSIGHGILMLTEPIVKLRTVPCCPRVPPLRLTPRGPASFAVLTLINKVQLAN